MSPPARNGEETSALQKRSRGKRYANLLAQKVIFFPLTINGLANKNTTAPI
jgi:hypothetical protein